MQLPEKVKAKEKRKDKLIRIQSSKNSMKRRESILKWQYNEIEENNRMGKTRDLFTPYLG